MKLIMNADDFGYSRGQNYGILECMLHGGVTSATLLTTTSGTKHAFELIKQHPHLDIGIHLTLDMGTPISAPATIPSLVNKDGLFPRYDLTKDTLGVDVDEVRKEWTAQIEYAINHGVQPTHFDSHHHIHMKEDIFPIFVELATKYQVAVRFHPRNFSPERKALFAAQIAHLPHADYFSNGFYEDGVSLDFFKNLPVTEDITIEAMCHPAFLDVQINTQSTYNTKRMEEVAVLTSPEMDKLIDALQIELISYGSMLKAHSHQK